MSDMSDEELRQFLKDNKERIEAIMAEDEKTNLERPKEKASEKKDNAEDTIKEMYDALMNPEAHRHFIRMGMEFFMGMSEILDKVPVPKPVRKFKEDIEESKAKAQNEMCRSNENCAFKKSQDDGLEKIELN